MKYNKKIPLGQDNIHLIIKSFEDGEFEYEEQFREHPTVTQNGKGLTIWNNIFTQIVKNFTKDGFQVGKIARGPWELVYVYDEDSGYIYTFMRGKNFTNLHKGEKSNIYHYSNILSRLNGELLQTYTLENEQISLGIFPTISVDTDKHLQEILEQMISQIDGDIVRYALVLADCRNGNVIDIECVIPIANTNPIYRESWKEFIDADYSIENYEVEETVPEENDIPLFNKETNIELEVKKQEIRIKNEEN